MKLQQQHGKLYEQLRHLQEELHKLHWQFSATVLKAK
jgi:hypothetical protein